MNFSSVKFIPVRILPLFRAAVDTMFSCVLNLTNRVGSVSSMGTNFVLAVIVELPPQCIFFNIPKSDVLESSTNTSCVPALLTIVFMTSLLPYETASGEPCFTKVAVSLLF